VARSIATAFEAAKVEWLAKLRSGKVETAADRKYLALSKIVGDPLPNGLAANLPRSAHSRTPPQAETDATADDDRRAFRRSK